jgi:hypothetical protein
MPSVRPSRLLTTAGLAAITALSCATPSAAAPLPESARTVSYHGYSLTVPADWRVVDLDRDPSACLLLDRPTVYLGAAGDQRSCPAHAVGGAPVIWIQPAGTPSVQPRSADGIASALVERAGVRVTTFGGAADRLGSARLTDGARPVSRPVTTSEPVAPLAAHEVPGTFRGKGFDACTAPSGTVMAAWKDTTSYRSIGIYIGGVSRACAQPNLTADWVDHRVRGGWHLLPIQVGLQAPCTGFSHRMSSDPATARDQGRGAAGAAVDNARGLGIGAGSVLYYDIEGYDSSNATCRRAVLNFLSGWTNRLRELNFRSGVYSSVSSGISDLSDTYDSTSYARPNHIWAAWWNGEANLDFRPYVPAAQWSNAQRVHQYRGGHNETHGGHTLNIDNNFLDVH